MPKLHYTSLLPMKKVCLIGMPYGMPKLIFNLFTRQPDGSFIRAR